MDEKEILDQEENLSEVPEKRDYEEELLKLIKSDEPPERLREDLSDYHENDIASILPELSQEERAKLYRLLGTEKMSEIFPYLDDVEEYIEELPSEKAADIIASLELSTSDATSLIWKQQLRESNMIRTALLSLL